MGNFGAGEGYLDVKNAIKEISLPFYLAHSDIRQRYRRSSLGPFWITISTGIMIGSMGLIFGKIFKAPVEEFIPFLSVGLILWGFIASVITESTNVFVNSQAIIRQLPLPLFSHVLRMVARNFIIFCHNVFILPIVYLAVGKGLNFNCFFLLPGLFLLILNLSWISLLLGTICTRFRDLTQIVSSLLQVFFYVTPIIWMPKLLPARADLMLLAPNPFYHLMEIVRAPLLGSAPSLLSWSYVFVLAIIGWFFTLYFFDKYRNKIPYWL